MGINDKKETGSLEQVSYVGVPPTQVNLKVFIEPILCSKNTLGVFMCLWLGSFDLF